MAAEDALRVVRDYLKVLAESGVPVWRVYLFGSWAKGTALPESDIDLAVFLDQDEMDGFEEDARLMKLRRRVDLRIEPRSFSRADAGDPDPFVREIMATGERVA
jgi:predicted nucleotidyltransferase